MTLAATLVTKFDTFVAEIVKFTVAASSTYSTGGDALDLSSILPAALQSQVPALVLITGVSGFIYRYVPGTTQANGKMQVFCNTAGAANGALGEHTAATYAAGVSGDTITGWAVFLPR